MTSPINSAPANAGKKIIETAPVRGNPMMLAFMLGALAITAKLTRDTYVGNEAREAQGVSAERAKKDYSLMMYDAGSMSGKGPMWDGLRHFAKWMDLYGPYGIKEDLQEFRDKVHSIWKEVIIPNLIPIGISLASIYGYFGPQRVHKPFKYTAKKLGEKLAGANYGSALTAKLKSLGKGTVNGSATLLEKMLKYPAVTAGVALLGAFGYKNWYEVKSGRAQDEYFRSEIFNNSGTVEEGL